MLKMILGAMTFCAMGLNIWAAEQRFGMPVKPILQAISNEEEAEITVEIQKLQNLREDIRRLKKMLLLDPSKKFVQCIKCNLQNMHLTKEDANGRTFDFTGSDLRGAVIDPGVSLRVILNNADLRNATIEKVHFIENSQFEKANLRGANAREADFGNADMTDVQLQPSRKPARFGGGNGIEVLGANFADVQNLQNEDVKYLVSRFAFDVPQVKAVGRPASPISSSARSVSSGQKSVLASPSSKESEAEDVE